MSSEHVLGCQLPSQSSHTLGLITLLVTRVNTNFYSLLDQFGLFQHLSFYLDMLPTSIIMAIKKHLKHPSRDTLPISWPNSTRIGPRRPRDSGYRTAQAHRRPLQHHAYQHRSPVAHHSWHPQRARTGPSPRDLVREQSRRLARRQQRRTRRIAD